MTSLRDNGVYAQITAVAPTGVTSILDYPKNMVCNGILKNCSTTVTVRIGGVDFDPDGTKYFPLGPGEAIGLSVFDKTSGGLKIFGRSESGSTNVALLMMVEDRN